MSKCPTLSHTLKISITLEEEQMRFANQQAEQVDGSVSAYVARLIRQHREQTEQGKEKSE